MENSLWKRPPSKKPARSVWLTAQILGRSAGSEESRSYLVSTKSRSIRGRPARVVTQVALAKLAAWGHRWQ